MSQKETGKVRRWGKSRRGCQRVGAPSVVSRRQQTWETVREMQICRPHPELWFGLSNLCAKPCRWFCSQIKSETHPARELFIQHLPACVTLQPWDYFEHFISGSVFHCALQCPLQPGTPVHSDRQVEEDVWMSGIPRVGSL